jgi:hypothetical protein
MKIWLRQDICTTTVYMSPVQHGQSIGKSGPTRQHIVKAVKCDDGHALVTSDGHHFTTI